MKPVLYYLLLSACSLVFCQDVGDKKEKNKQEFVPKIEIRNPDGTTSSGQVVGSEDVGTRYILPYREEAHASFDALKVYDQDGKLVKPELNKVCVIQYWSKTGLKGDKAWEKFIEQQNKYSGNADIQFLSIYFDLSSNTLDAMEKGIAFLKKNGMSIPKNLFFDFNDSFREHFQVYGQNSYYLIDNRQQLTNASRGDFEEVNLVFEGIENAMNNFKKDGYHKGRIHESQN